MTGEQVEQKWEDVKWKRHSCPNCMSYRIHLVWSLTRRWRKYSLECWTCHWCGPRASTIDGAIRKWNRYGEEQQTKGGRKKKDGNP